MNTITYTSNAKVTQSNVPIIQSNVGNRTPSGTTNQSNVGKNVPIGAITPKHTAVINNTSQHNSAYYEYNKELDLVVIKIKNSNGYVVKQIPTKEFVQMREALGVMIGNLLNTRG